ncbi:histidinol phosphate phosphatase [Pelosinus propionicus]|uniref:Histidinol-phosphatase n=1 Tax=Pelosinus propionicus DSM 13327 TaxID=1123291 RepID=A0A1I4KLZ9_9FIRM|nr:histidinol phosphate phosphatase [Pelosinus propionicus]SFL79681.1 histidinol-phosphatase (PHP family) [Pelosinus propionicus DSM 13327]
MLFDSHMHTCFSTDSKMKMADAVVKAEELNIGIIITEHMDIAYPEPKAFIFDVEKYFSQYAQYRNEKVLLGIEIGMRSDCLEENCRLVEKYPFDYVIGSVHVIDNIDLYTPEFYQGRTKQEAYEHYFKAMKQCVTCYDGIHSLGHIDYIARYARFQDPEVYYHEFSDYIDEILTILAQKEKALEINTRRLGNKAAVETIIPIYKRFYELGGRIVTIGSDAHNVKDVGRELLAGLEIAERSNLNVVHFKEGKLQFHK